MKLPPLGPLRAFEAAGRHLSFTRAAEELHLTQGAVSQQVKQLEEHLGFALFRRLTRRLELTEEGRAFHAVVASALRQISDKVESLKSSAGNRPVTISVVPSFAVKWLIPRLTRFRRAHPEIAIRVDADHRIVDLRSSEVDLAIRFVQHEPEGLHAVELFRDLVFPVCSPDLVREGRAPTRLEDLRHAVLLHESAPLWNESASDWDHWLKAVGLEDAEAPTGPGYTQGDMVLQAAILGEGVALTRSSLAELDLASGRLVRPLDESIPCPRINYLVCHEEALRRPDVATFYGWLV
ncbi:MAG TPA: transcriptional regulator GcvA, partial [Arenicellales bacterium]|nr:transcriptional regulator GcvA [Arenicellales bacterium]